MVAPLHFAESAFPLHLLFERFQRLIDVVVANENLNDDPSSSWSFGKRLVRRSAKAELLGPGLYPMRALLSMPGRLGAGSERA